MLVHFMEGASRTRHIGTSPQPLAVHALARGSSRAARSIVPRNWVRRHRLDRVGNRVRSRLTRASRSARAPTWRWWQSVSSAEPQTVRARASGAYCLTIPSRGNSTVKSTSRNAWLTNGFSPLSKVANASRTRPLAKGFRVRK